MPDERPLSLNRLAGTVGVWTTTTESMPAAHASELAAEIEGLGYPALWIPEAWGRESFTNAGLLLAGTTALTVATGIANIYGRDAVAAAAAARTLNAAYGDRFVLGLGVSHQPLVERLRGQAYQSPIAVMRDYLTAMNKAPMFAPEGEQRYARVIAALGPQMLALAAELTDGAHTYLVSVEHTAEARAALGQRFLAVEQAVVLGEDRSEFLRRAHAHLEIYTGLANYRASWRRQGFTEDDFVRGGSDRLCDAMVVHGDEAAIAAAVERHRRAGADHVCVQVLGENLTDPPREALRRLAPALLG